MKKRNALHTVILVILIILGIIFVLGIIFNLGIIFVIRCVREIQSFVIASNHHMPDMALDIMQSSTAAAESTLELNKSAILQNAHTNQAIAKEQKRRSIFTNENSVGDGVGLPLLCPKMQIFHNLFVLSVLSNRKFAGRYQT